MAELDRYRGARRCSTSGKEMSAKIFHESILADKEDRLSTGVARPAELRSAVPATRASKEERIVILPSQGSREEKKS